jgi:glutaredoxin-like protein NrdH
MMIDKIEYINEEGEKCPCEITVYALSTCGFCRRSILFLKEKNIKFRYVHVDLLDTETKDEVKNYLSEKFNTRIGFPFAVLDGRDFLRGFDQQEWEKKLCS